MNTYYRYFIKKNIKVSDIVTIEYLDIGKVLSPKRKNTPFSNWPTWTAAP